MFKCWVQGQPSGDNATAEDDSHTVLDFGTTISMGFAFIDIYLFVPHGISVPHIDNDHKVFLFELLAKYTKIRIQLIYFGTCLGIGILT
jgi:hypothetical protein